MSFVSSLFKEKPDHPMFSLEEAERLLGEMKRDDYFKALSEITGWLDSLKDTPGFRPEVRLNIIMLLDETGQPFYSELLQLYLGEPHLQDFKGLQLWRELHNFMRTLSEAFEVCLNEYRRMEKKPPELVERLPVICVRQMRAIGEQMKIELMHYVDIEQQVWDRLFACYNFAVESQIAETMVFAYPRQPLNISPQRELLRAMSLDVSSPGTLAQDQIEVCARIITRMVSFFDFRDTPDPDCPWCLDLAQPAPPHPAGARSTLSPTLRFFGMTRAVPKVTDIINQHLQGLIQQEQRFGSEFTPAGKLTVLRHVQQYWARELPHPHQEHRPIHTAIEVVHAFDTISKLVTRMDVDNATNISEEDAAMLKQRSGINLEAAEESLDYTTESWEVSDISLDEIGCVLPRNSGTWVKIGDLCGLKPTNGNVWWVGMIRQLHTDANGVVHAGIDVLAKKPLAVWLRSLGRGAEKVSAWESSSGSFAYDYLSVILLPDANNSYANATMLMASGTYLPDMIYEVMLGEKSRNIKLTSLLAEGEDFEQVGFEWLAPG